MRKKIVAGNWKMHGNKKSLQTLAGDIQSRVALTENFSCIVFPPFVYLDCLSQQLAESGIDLGAQNVYPSKSGAYTGEVSPSMLLDLNCRYVLVGHSERRHLLGESDQFIADKFHHVKEHGMIPVLCVGETLEAREGGHTEKVIARQLAAVTERGGKAFETAVIAYEPVWAIGTGKNASPDQAQKVHAFIRQIVEDSNPGAADDLPVLYGGSVKGDNARALFDMPDIDGGLVGGASLEAEKFLEIIECIN